MEPVAATFVIIFQHFQLTQHFRLRVGRPHRFKNDKGLAIVGPDVHHFTRTVRGFVLTSATLPQVAIPAQCCQQVICEPVGLRRVRWSKEEVNALNNKFLRLVREGVHVVPRGPRRIRHIFPHTTPTEKLHTAMHIKDGLI